jgi:hypothetical protein
MSELLKKYESIDQSKLNEATVKILNRVKTITVDFTADDAKNNDIAEKVINEIMKKNPDAVKIVKREPKAKTAPKKAHKAKTSHTTKHKAKASHTKTSTASTSGATKSSENNIMAVAKSIRKDGESFKDAMERAKEVLKERKEKSIQKSKTELQKLYELIKTKKELQGFANSDIRRDSVRSAKVRGARIVTKEGYTSNAYGTFPNKLGRKYWETRDRHSDRLAPNYPKDMPLLAEGGSVDKYDIDRFKQVLNGEAIAKYIVRLQDYMGNKETYVFGIKIKDRLKGCTLSPYEVLYGSWTDRGTPFSLSNLQVEKLVPNTFTKVDLDENETADLVSRLLKGDKEGVEKFLKSGFFYLTNSSFEQTLKAHFAKSVVKFVSVEFEILSKFENGGGIEKENSLKHFILNEASSGMIANKTPYSDYKSIDAIRNTAIQILNRDGDREYSVNSFSDLIQEALLEYEENKSESSFSDGGTMWTKDKLEDEINHYKNLLRNIDKYPDYNKKNVEKIISELEDKLENENYKKGGKLNNEDKLLKELHRLQRDLNSSRLQTYRLGDDSEEEKARQIERETKLARFYEVLKELRESDAKFADGGSLPILTDPNFGDFQKPILENGGSMADLTEQEFLKKHFSTSVFFENPSQYFEIKKMSSDDDSKVNAFVKELKADGFTVKKRAYSDFTSVMGVKKKASFELGGAFMTTDLAGHSGGGTGGLNANMPLSGTSGTYYDGLVGETGAMSSGELFEAGGVMAQNQQVIDDASQPYVITEAFGNPAQHLAKGGSLKDVKIKDWYTQNYPMDDLGEEIDDNATFEDLWNSVNQKMNIYDVIGVGDSLVRERLFEHLSELKAVGYKYVYDKWLESDEYAKGGAIINQYEGRTAEDVWNVWSFDQRRHFLIDHFLTNTENNDSERNQVERLKTFIWDNLPRLAQMEIERHLFMGQYSSGGSLKNAKKLSEEDIFELRVLQGLSGFNNGLNNNGLYESLGLSNYRLNQYATNSQVEKVKKTLDSLIKKGFVEESGLGYKITQKGGDYRREFHYSSYAYGGKTKSTKSMRELYIEQIASMTGTRVTGVDNFAKEHNLNDSELSNLMTGIGRGMVLKADFATALVGDKDSLIQKKIVAFAKSGDAYKMAKGGAINGNLNKKIKLLAEKKGYTMDKLGRDEYNKLMTQALVESLTDANFHEEAKEVVAKAEKKEWSDDLYKSVYFNPDDEVGSFAREVARECDWTGDDIINAYFFVTKMEGSKVATMIEDLFIKEEPKKSNGFTPTVEFKLGDIVWDKGNESYGIVMNAYGDSKEGDGGEIRLDSDGNQSIFTFDKDWNISGYNLNKLGSKGDEGKFYKIILDEMKASAKRLIAYRKEAKDKDGVAYYEEVYKRLLDGEFDSMVKEDSKPTKYIDHDDIKSVTVMYKGSTTIFKGEDVLNGANLLEDGGDLSKIAFYIPKRDVISVELKNGDAINPVNGYWIKKGAEPISVTSLNPVNKKDENKAHFEIDTEGTVYADSNFVNQSQGNLPNSELKHYGFGEFYLETPDGNIDFIRREEKKDGFVGRTHKVKGNEALILKLIEAMYEKGRFESGQTLPSFANGGGLSDYMNSPQYKEMVENQNKLTLGIKSKVVQALGLDGALDFYDSEYPIRPYELLRRAVLSNFITLDDINKNVIDSALETARESEEEEEIGSSDFTSYLHKFLDGAGFKVGFVNSRLTREFANGGEIADIDKMKKSLIAKAKAKGIYENFGQKEVRQLQDKYGYTDNVRRFDDWAMDFDLSKLANGGGVGVKHFVGEFNEQQLRKGEDKIAIKKAQEQTGLNYIQSKLIKKSGKPFMQVYLISNENYLNSKEFADGGNLMEVHNGTAFMDNPIYADSGLMIDDNDGFMKAKNGNNYRYPERDVHVYTTDEPIELNDNVSYPTNNVTIQTLGDPIDLTDDSVVKARLSYVDPNRTPKKLSAVNPRMIIEGLPKPTSQTHKND